MQFPHNDPLLKARRQELRHEMTPEEHLLWSRLRNRKFLGLKFFRQFGVDRFILDFYCPKFHIGIELDGSQHASVDGRVYDFERETILNSLGITVIRFKNHEFYCMDNVLEKLRVIFLKFLPPLELPPS
ncbi:MAG: endonuclease domain-containing protein [Candidatus Uhrbacteria bacterium]